MRTPVTRSVVIVLCAVGFASPLSVSAQTRAAEGRTRSALVQQAAQQAAADGAQVRRLTVDEAVRLAAENNLGIQVARFDPQIETLNILQARTAWTPTLDSSVQYNTNTSPPNSFLSGAPLALNTNQFQMNADIRQALRWGGASYSVGIDGARSTSNNFFSTFNPQLRSSLALNYTQPLMRGFKFDNVRQQIQISQKNREIADVTLRQTLTATSRTVRNSYWDLAFTIASLRVARQSLELAEESLRNTKARVDIGTTPPIDIVEAEAEVATRREAVILGEADIETAQDILRALVYNPSMPDFWTIRIEPVDLPPFEITTVDVDSAVRNALERRTDLMTTKKGMEQNDINIKYLKNQTLPEVTAIVDYGLSAIGGVQLVRAPGVGLAPGDIISEERRGLGSVFGDLLSNDFPQWTLSLNFSYPLGTSQQQANLARVRLQQTKEQTQLKSQELQVATQVRQVARELVTNQQRVLTTRVSREFAERRLDAEERKFDAGTSTNFFVFQAQRDLAVARNNELAALVDFYQSKVDLETVQEVPLR